LAIIEMRIALPRINWNGLALIPIRLKPFCSSARIRAPRSAPMTVPEPPASAVPPMTAAEIAVKTSAVPPPILGSMLLIRNASRSPLGVHRPP
jgi:hypothetical protein